MNKLLMSCVAVVVVMFLAFAIPVPLSAVSKGDCYPGSATVIASGATSAAGEAHGKLGEIDTERHSTVATNRGPANVDIEFVANIDSTGKLTGRAEVKIKWLDTTKTGGIAETDFEAGCVNEIETNHQTSVKVGEFEGEYEGAVENYPGYNGTSKAAVLSIVAREDDIPGRVAVDFTIELGYTCFENVYAGTSDDIELGKVTLSNLDPDEFKINNVGHHGRMSNPDPLLFGNCGA
jgi:hypothetical protein